MKRKGFLVCLVSELMLVSGIILTAFGLILVLSGGMGGCQIPPCPTHSFVTSSVPEGVALILASAVGFAIGLPIVWCETTPSGTAS